MTIRTMVWILVLCGLAWVGGLAYLSRDKRIKQLAQEQSLSAQETKALRLCLRDFAEAASTGKPAASLADHAAAESRCMQQARKDMRRAAAGGGAGRVRMAG